MGNKMMAGMNRLIYILLIFTPFLVMSTIAFWADFRKAEAERLAAMKDQAQSAEGAVNLLLSKLLDFAQMCAESPHIVTDLDLGLVREECGRISELIDGWTVVIEIGDIHRQIMNTQVLPGQTLPTYPRSEEYEGLLSAEEESRRSGAPVIADVFTGLVYPSGVITAGMFVRASDGRDLMVYVGYGADRVNELLAREAGTRGRVIALTDRSRRIVSRSVDFERYMFARMSEELSFTHENPEFGTATSVIWPAVASGLSDAAYVPVGLAPGWMVIVAENRPVGVTHVRAFSFPLAIAALGAMASILTMGLLHRIETIRRELALAELARNEAERHDRQKSDLLAALAHEIRSPVTGLVSVLKTALDAKRVPSDASNISDESLIEGAVRMAEVSIKIMDDVLDLSNLDSDNYFPLKDPVNFEQMISDTRLQFEKLAIEKGLELSFTLAPELPETAIGDQIRICQVIWNLVSNAIKFTNFGRVDVAIRRVPAPQGKLGVRFMVADTGIGIDPMDFPIIFREYGRLERSGTRGEKSTGLGLAICQRILRKMGSQLFVESARDIGSTFYFELEMAEHEFKADVDQPKFPAGYIIVYAEDNALLRIACTQMLINAGARVFPVDDGRAALELINSVTPDLILLDIEMKNIDGIEVLRRIKAMPDKIHVKLVMLTGHYFGARTDEAYMAGADAVLMKPLNLNEIVKVTLSL